MVDPSDIGSMGITHYLPHHAVIKEDKQTSKLCIFTMRPQGAMGRLSMIAYLQGLPFDHECYYTL